MSALLDPAPQPASDVDIDPRALVEDVSGLVSPPVVCARMYDLIQSQNASSGCMADLVALDPNISLRLLKIVNSSYYGFPSEVDTIAKAITILGTQELYNLVLAISAVRSFSGMGVGLTRTKPFWHHSIYVALIARRLARRMKLDEPDRLFVAGLLHDVGSAVIYSQLTEPVEAMREVAASGEPSLFAAERSRFGFSHADVGAILLETWQLPARLRHAILHHHDPALAPQAPEEAAVLHIADTLANHCAAGAFWPGSEADYAVDPAALEALELDTESLDEAGLREEADVQFAEVAGILTRA